jgi:hypothetical protein
MQIGYKLAAAAFGPAELIRHASRAEAAGFDFVDISDHFHPWLEKTGVMSELPNPVNFAAASATVREDDILAQFASGSDVLRYVEVAQQFVGAGFDHLFMQHADPGFIDFYQRELHDRFDAKSSRLAVPPDPA